MRVLIRTLALGHGNYGGIMQAWALQQVLREMGNDPVTDVSVRPGNGRLRTLKAAVLAARRLLPLSWTILPHDRDKYRNSPLMTFVDEHIVTVRVFRRSSARPRKSVLSDVEAFIVGSDQVWRQDYADVPSYLFDFLRPDDSRPRIAYSASMGALSLVRWSKSELEHLVTLWRRFTALSVRERSASEWMRVNAGMDASVTPDPTMLVERNDYDNLISEIPESASVLPFMLVYILDTAPGRMEYLRQIADMRGLQLVVADPPSLRLRRSIPEWLRLIRDADVVVTDSFHGTVFSIIFETSFVALVNRERGADRFDELVARFDLPNRFIDDVHDASDVLNEYIDWRVVRQRLQRARVDGREYLTRALPKLDGRYS